MEYDEIMFSFLVYVFDHLDWMLAAFFNNVITTNPCFHLPIVKVVFVIKTMGGK